MRSSDNATLAATFARRDDANAALADLHRAGFRNVWLVVTRGDASTAGGATVDSGASSGGVGASIGRFFSGEGSQSEALHEALVRRGLANERARRLESTLPSGSAVVTVDGENDPDEALTILESHGGTIDEGYSAAPAATTVDDARRLQLREERLQIDKQRVSGGTARIGKEVVSEQQSIDVPVFHEEVFIARRPVTGAAATASATPIGEGEEIRIPLTAERVDVAKRTVVTEEVTIGKRQVEETQHVDETLRREELSVDDTASQSRATDPRLRDR